MAAVLPSRDEQAQERRRQLVRIASDLIEEGGLDAVTLPRVTARARCARTLSYRYFASREELLAAVLQDYVERLDARLPAARLRGALRGALADVRRGDDASIRALVAVFWEVQMAAGLGGAILRGALHVHPEVEALIARSRRAGERRIAEGLRAAGLDGQEAQVAIDALIASFVGLALRWRRGKIGRERAIDVHARVTAGLIRGLLRVPPPRGSRRRVASGGSGRS